MAERKCAPCATLAVRVQTPKPTKDTECPSVPTAQTAVEMEATEVGPSPVVETEATKEPNSVALVGTLATAGVEGVAKDTEKTWAVPSLAPKLGVPAV